MNKWSQFTHQNMINSIRHLVLIFWSGLTQQFDKDDWLHFIKMINVCGSGHSHSPAVSVPLMRQGEPWSEVVNTPQTFLLVSPTPEREPFFEVDESKKSDFLNPQYLAVCYLEQNLIYNSDLFPLMSQTRVTVRFLLGWLTSWNLVSLQLWEKGRRFPVLHKHSFLFLGFIYKTHTILLWWLIVWVDCMWAKLWCPDVWSNSGLDVAVEGICRYDYRLQSVDLKQKRVHSLMGLTSSNQMKAVEAKAVFLKGKKICLNTAT